MKNCKFLVSIIAAFLIFPPSIFCGQKSNPEIGEIINGAIANVDKVSKEIAEGNLRMAEMGIGILEKDVRLIGKNLPIEKVYAALAEAEDFINKNTLARAKKSLEGALAEVKKIKGVDKEALDSLGKNIKEAIEALGKGSGDLAKQSIGAANDALDKIGARANYKKAQSHLAKAKAAVIDGSIEGAKSEISGVKESLGGLRDNIEGTKVRASIENAITMVNKGAVVPAQNEIKNAVNGIAKINPAAAGETGKKVLEKAAEDLKNTSADIGSGIEKTKEETANKLNDILISIEEFLE